MKRYFFINFLKIFAIGILILLIQTAVVSLEYFSGRNSWKDQVYDEYVDELEDLLEDTSSLYITRGTIQNFLKEIEDSRISGLLISDVNGYSMMTLGTTPKGAPMGLGQIKSVSINAKCTRLDLTNGEVNRTKEGNVDFTVNTPGSVSGKDILGTVVISIDGSDRFYVSLLSFTPMTYEDTKVVFESCLHGLVFSIPVCVVIALLYAWIVSKRNTKMVNDIRESLNDLTEGKDTIKVNHFKDKKLNEIPVAIEELDQSLKANKRSQRAWLSSISHDLNTPLTASQMVVEGINDKVLPVTDENLNSLQTEVKSLSDRVKRISEYSDLLTHVSADYNVFDCNAFVTELCNAYPTADIKCSLDTINADRKLLMRACEEMLNNALVFDSNSKLSIRSDDSYVIIDVRNTGKLPDGLDGSVLFEPWTRGDCSRNNSGNGLGLSIVGAIASLHGGCAVIKQENESTVLAEVAFPLR